MQLITVPSIKQALGKYVLDEGLNTWHRMAGTEMANVKSGIYLEKKKCIYTCVWYICIYILVCIYIYISICFVQKIKYVLFYTKCTKHLGGHGDEGEKNTECLHVRWIQAGRTEIVWGAGVLTPNCIQETQCLVEGQIQWPVLPVAEQSSFHQRPVLVTASSFWDRHKQRLPPLVSQPHCSADPRLNSLYPGLKHSSLTYHETGLFHK